MGLIRIRRLPWGRTQLRRPLYDATSIHLQRSGKKSGKHKTLADQSPLPDYGNGTHAACDVGIHKKHDLQKFITVSVLYFSKTLLQVAFLQILQLQKCTTPKIKMCIQYIHIYELYVHALSGLLTHGISDFQVEWLHINQDWSFSLMFQELKDLHMDVIFSTHLNLKSSASAPYPRIN